MDCGICTDGLKDPVSTKCGHVFCDACINDVIKRAGRGNSANCPTCQKELKGPNRPLLKLALDTSRHDDLRQTNVSLRNELKFSLLECERIKNYVAQLERECHRLKRKRDEDDADTQSLKRRCTRAESDAERFRRALLVQVGAMVTAAGSLAMQHAQQMIDDGEFEDEELEEEEEEDVGLVQVPTSDGTAVDENPFVDRSVSSLFSAKAKGHLDTSGMNAAAEAMRQQARRWADEESVSGA
ncbi:hypothetical protein EV714DRAFT_254908 [Schizophyllum commune]